MVFHRGRRIKLIKIDLMIDNAIIIELSNILYLIVFIDNKLG